MAVLYFAGLAASHLSQTVLACSPTSNLANLQSAGRSLTSLPPDCGRDASLCLVKHQATATPQCSCYLRHYFENLRILQHQQGWKSSSGEQMCYHVQIIGQLINQTDWLLSLNNFGHLFWSFLLITLVTIQYNTIFLHIIFATKIFYLPKYVCGVCIHNAYMCVGLKLKTGGFGKCFEGTKQKACGRRTDCEFSITIRISGYLCVFSV